MATKKQKRLAGEARQEQHLKDTIASGLKALHEAHEIRDRKRALTEERVKKAMAKAAINNIANPSVNEEILDTASIEMECI